ncbi:LCP family protein [Ruminococcus albus]|uniref:Transcriptional attenuator, LytR family n=1 Tax=Ruminococcus albus TaxID=1264 RepID=A0A1I1I599_RUMAL|nr:LCP family protein [Ruminococcus albus]SFC31336.1 transcriptional attenuator, LytR family [Ruminococcus albus]
MSSAAKKRKRKRRSQAPVALVYVVTALVFMALISMLSIYLMKSYGLLKEDEDENAVVTVQTFNDLFARVNSKGVLSDMTLIRIDPADDSILVVPISAMTVSKTNNMTMRDIFSNQRMAGVKDAVEGTFGLNVNNYATLSNDAFERVCDIYGGITYKAPEELYYLSKDNNENDISIMKGELASLGGRQIRLLTQYPVFSNGKQGNNEFLGEAMESLINSMFQQDYITKDNLDNIYSIITTNSDTDLNLEDFKLQKSYIKDMLSSKKSPAQKLIPSGTWGENDSTFVISEDFITELKEKAAETVAESGASSAAESSTQAQADAKNTEAEAKTAEQ